ncbi:MAG: DUF1566 domain-containing protein [Nitrospira sp.]
MMQHKQNRWMSGVGVLVLVGGLSLANYGGGVAPAAAHDHQNPFKQILGKLNEILAKLNTGGGGAGAGNYTQRWDTNHPSATRFTVLTEFNGAAVRDNNTGLVWEQSPATFTPGPTWNDARLQCIDKNVGGTRGWRLPSVVELASLIDPSLPAPSVPAVFTGVQLAPYWSATANAVGSSTALSVNFDDGHVGMSSKSSSNSIWCVRGLMQESVY